MGDQDGNMSGDGATSPFGNGEGSYSPEVPPAGNPMPAKVTSDESANADSIPAGGKNLPSTLGDAAGVVHKPYKITQG